MLILTVGHICLVLILPPSELTSMVCFMVAIGRLCFATKLNDMNEWDALESNKIVAGCELVGNIPGTTSWACRASSLVIWLTLPYMKLCFPCGFAWFLAPGTTSLVRHYQSKWPVKPHLKQAPPLRLPWASAFYEVGALGRGHCCMFCRDGCCTLGRGACWWGFYI
jgi:hypothetical protein